MKASKIHKSLFKIIKTVAKPLRGYDLNRFRLIRATLNLTLKYLKPKYVRIEGNTIFLDREDSLRLSIVGVYEPTMVGIFKEKIKKGDTVVDIGGHIGYYTLLAAKLVGEKGKVFSFEPDSTNFELLKKNVGFNGYSNVTIINKAVSEKTNKMKFFLSSNNDAHHSLVDNGGSRDIMVDAISIDDYFDKEIPKVSVIKMDVEGGEYSAILGALGVIDKNKNVCLFTEFSPEALKRAGRSPKLYLDLLRSHGFKLFNIDEHMGTTYLLNEKDLFKSHSLGQDWHVNLLGVKS